MTTTGSSIVNALGGGSGVDMTQLATQLAEAQFQGRTKRLETRSETLEKRISLASTLKNTLSQFADALGSRVRAGDLAPSPTIANGSVARVSSPIGTVGKGSYALEVDRLATSQVLAGPAMADRAAPLGAGTLTLRFGAVTADGFTQDSGHAPLAVEVPEGATIDDVARLINARGAGVTAYVATGTAGAQLVLKGQEGQTSGFVIEAAPAAADGSDGAAADGSLTALAWQPGDDPARLLTGAGDAQYRLDGIARTSATNTIANAAPGLGLTLTGTNSGAPTTIGFGNPATAIGGAMQDIVSALNELAGQVRDATDPMTGELSRDPGARALASALARITTQEIMPGAPDGAPRTLAELGVSIARDGSFTLDRARLETTLARNPDGVAAMFTPGINGVFATFDKLARSNGTGGGPGTLGGSINQMQRQSQQIGVDLTDLADAQERLRATMVSRFAAADTRIQSSQSTLSFLQSQIDVWNAQKN